MVTNHVSNFDPSSGIPNAGSLTQIFASSNIGSAKATAGFENGVGVGTHGYSITGTGNADVTVTAVFSATNILSNTLSETNAGLTTTGNLTVTDVDTSDVVTATRTLAVSGSSNRTNPAAPSDANLLEMLTLTPTNILDGTENTATLNWSFDSGSEAFDYLAAGETLILTYTVTATDNSGEENATSSDATVTVTVTGTNDAPTLDLDTTDSGTTNYAFTFTEGNSATSILTSTSDTSLTDVDSSSFDKVTVAFDQSNFADGASESLIISGASLGGTISNLGGLTNGATGSFTLSSVVYDFSVAVAGSNATISFTGDSAAELSTAEAEALLDALQYNNSSNNPTASSDRVLSINAFDGDAQTSNTATSTITVAAANDAPTLDLDTTDSGTTNYAFTFTEGNSATSILTSTSDTSLTDVDSSSFDKVTVAFDQSNFADGASESLNISGASLGGTISNLGGLTNGATGSFTSAPLSTTTP